MTLLTTASKILKTLEKIKASGVPQKIIVMAIAKETGMNDEDVVKVLRAFAKVKPAVKKKLKKKLN